MNLRLQTMTIENFKGISALTLNLEGKSAAISGRNGCGKSSIVDAFCWALFGTNANGDSAGSDKFQEKPLDANGNVVHNLTTSVQLDFLLDEKPFSVKREQSESWVRRRGSAESTLQGNVSKFFINGVELKKNEFEERISSVVSVDTFKQIGVLGYFNAMDWKKRRQCLTALASSDVDSQLLQNPEYKAIADEVAKRNVSVDDLKKALADQQKAIGKELKALPIRIDEAKKSMPVLGQHDASDAEYMIADTQKDIERVDKLIIETKARGINGNQAQIQTLEVERDLCIRQLKDAHEADTKRARLNLDQAVDAARAYESKIAARQSEAESLKVLLSRAVAERDALRKKYVEVRAEKPETSSDTCPVCGQPLPHGKASDAHNEWEKNRKHRLLDIQTNGKLCADRVADLEQKIAVIDREIEQLSIDLSNANADAVKMSAICGALPAEPDYASNPQIAELEGKIAELKAMQDASGVDKKVEQLLERRKDMYEIIDRAKAVLAKRDLAVEAESRIAEYEKQVQEKGAELSETELLLDQLDNFTQARCTALENGINSRFTTIRWKLFDALINGSINDCCTCMIDCDGVFVPYSSANTASQINADIQIVDVLSKHYGVKIPLFVDNAERCVNLTPIDTQVITLAVSTDDRLKVELID